MATYYWVGGSGAWGSSWALTSGGLPVTVTPTNADLCVFDANSGGGTISTSRNKQIGSVDFTGFTGTLTMSTALYVFGDFIASSTLTLSASTIRFNGTTTQILSGNGVTFNGVLQIFSTGTVQLNSDFNSVNGITLSSGIFNLNGYTATATTFTSSGASDLTFNNGSLILTATGSVFNNTIGATFTTTAGSGIGSISLTGVGTKIFTGGNSVYNCSLQLNALGSLTITDNNIFNNITNLVNPVLVIFTAGTTTAFKAFNLNGIIGNIVGLQSTIPGTQAILSNISGQDISCDYVGIKDISAITLNWYAGNNSVDISNNTGWTFTSPPAPPIAPTILYGAAGKFKGEFIQEIEKYNEDDDEEIIIMGLIHKFIEMRVI